MNPIRSRPAAPQNLANKKPATLADVARAAKVSRWIAGNVLNGGNGNSRCSQETRNRVLQAAQQLNYHPNHAARQLAGKRSHTFGILVASAGDPLRSFLVQYLDAEAVKLGCQTMISNTIGNPAVGPDQFEYCVEELSRRGVDGVLCAVHRWFPGDRKALLAAHPCTVFYEDAGMADSPMVSVDRAAAVRLAVRHLIERGHERIGLAVMSLARPTHVARYVGYADELAFHGRTVDPRLIFNGQPYGLAAATCNEAAKRWEFPREVVDRAIDALVRDAAADAIVAHDDFWAATLLKRMRARGIRVPHDVAVVGYLNHYLADWTDPALTTLDLQHDLAARAMVQMLERMVQGQTIPAAERTVKVEPTLIVREST
jgi:DNA-binding LacI/PurR family transcriptional regulator